MEIFVINLDKDVNRLQFANSQANKHKFSFQRVAGIYGSSLTKPELKKSVNSFRFYCSMGRLPKLGEIGCALSHLKIYRQMVEENISSACILEDDIIVFDGFNEQLNALENWFDKEEPQVVRINYGTQERTGDIPAIRDNSKTSACSYCLNLPAAKALLKDNFPIKTVADAWPRWSKIGLVNVYDSNPKVCWHNNSASGFNSVIAEQDRMKNDANMISRSIQIIGRIIGTIIDRTFIYIGK